MGFDCYPLPEMNVQVTGDKKQKRDRWQVTSDMKIQNVARTVIRVTCYLSLATLRLAAGLILLFGTLASLAQSNVVSHANDFTSVEYYPAPNQQQMKSRLSGAEAQPLPGGLLAIKQLKLEMFKPDGQMEIVVIAPECVYNQLDGTASSPGRLEVRTGDDRISVEGEGFLWRQNDSFLTISNQSRTVIKMGSDKTAKL